MNVILSEAKLQRSPELLSGRGQAFNLGSIFERSFPGQMNGDVSLRST